MLERIRRARRDESGFTLIELLIVIVILGILAAIVVFAVNGIQDRGTASACKADVETVTVAAKPTTRNTATTRGPWRNSSAPASSTASPPTATTPSTTRAGPRRRPPRQRLQRLLRLRRHRPPSRRYPRPPTRPSAELRRAAYCDLLQSTMRNLSGVDINTVEDDGFNVLIKAFDSLAGAAPDGIAQDWQRFANALRSVETILNNAGLHWRDLSDAENGNLPDMNQADSDALRQQIQDVFDNSALGAAMNEIGQDANDNCSLDVGKG